MTKKKTAATTADGIIDAALDLAVTRPWSRIGLRDISEAAGVPLAGLLTAFPDKAAILKGFLDRVDRQVLAEEVDMADEPRQRLFEVLMRRFDALSPHREAVRAILRDSCTDPLTCAQFMPRFGRSMAWMLEAAGISASGLCGLARINGLGLVYAQAFRVWLDDEREDLSRTMAALDKALDRAAPFARMCDGGLPRPFRRRDRHADAA